MPRLLPVGPHGASVTSLVAIVAFVAGCASGPPELSEQDQAAIDGADLALIGTDNLEFDPATASVDAGEIEIALTCEQGVNHNVVIEDEIVATCNRGQTVTGTIDLEPGEYEYVCTVPGHAQRMRGDLTVE